MPDTQQRIALLKKIHLFAGMPDDKLAILAENMEERVFADPGEIFTLGQKTDGLYFIFSGSVIVTRYRDKKPIRPDAYFIGDYFGLEPAFNRAKRDSKAEAQANTTLLVMKPADLVALVKESDHLRSSIQVMDMSRKLTTKLYFSWLQPDETIYLLSRKHPIVLYQMLLPPIFVALVPVFFLTLWALIPESVIPPLLAGLLTILDILWVIWTVIDYGNDYYIVTNRRIVWLEKVIFLYDSRQESPLSMVMPVNVEIGLLGRILDFGNVIVRTYTSRIAFIDIERPNQVVSMIEEYRNRTQDVVRKQEVDAMKQAIRVQLGLAKPPAKAAPAAPKPPKGGRFAIPRIIFRELFKMRVEEAGKIVYRKHWFILIEQVTWPTSLFVLDIVLIFLNLFYNTTPDKTFTILLLIGWLPLFLWWVYQFVDWRNDRFELTSEQIADIDKVPLGQEERKSGKLEDIQSINYRRVGLPAILLNYGTVYIMVGTTEFTFDDVQDPASVQSELEAWRNQRLTNKRNAETASERERMAEWLATYHKSAEEFRPSGS